MEYTSHWDNIPPNLKMEISTMSNQSNSSGFSTLMNVLAHPVETIKVGIQNLPRFFHWDVEEVGLFTMEPKIVEVDDQRPSYLTEPQMTHVTKNEYVPVSGYKAIVRPGVYRGTRYCTWRPIPIR